MKEGTSEKTGGALSLFLDKPRKEERKRRKNREGGRHLFLEKSSRK